MSWNVFESLQAIGGNLMEWEPQIPRPEADGPVEDIRQYEKHEGAVVGYFYLTNHPAYMIDELPQETPVPASNDVQDHIARIASEAATLRAEHGDQPDAPVINQEAVAATPEFLEEEADKARRIEKFAGQVDQSYPHKYQN